MHPSVLLCNQPTTSQCYRVTLHSSTLYHYHCLTATVSLTRVTRCWDGSGTVDTDELEAMAAAKAETYRTDTIGVKRFQVQFQV